VPSDREIQAEAARLVKMKPDVGRFSYFGDDHHTSMDAQVSVLNEGLDENGVYDRYAGGPYYLLRGALEACRWMRGESDEDGPPSESWKTLLRK